jgi:hypothetical protein
MGKKSHSPIVHLNEIEVTGPLADHADPVSGRRHINLNKDERRALANQARIEKAVSLFLDLEADHTWQQIADELHISLQWLRQLTKTKEFMDCYNEHFVELGHDPRLRATQAALADLLPVAFRQLRGLLTRSGVSDTVRLNTIREVLKLNGIEDAPPVSDKSELAKFLKEANLTVVQNNNVTNNVPAEFAEKIKEYTEGTYTEIPSEEMPDEP